MSGVLYRRAMLLASWIRVEMKGIVWTSQQAGLCNTRLEFEFHLEAQNG